MHHTHRALGSALKLLTVVIVAACAIAGSQATPTAASTGEIRAMWVTRATLSSPASIAAMVRAAEEGGFNTLIVQVRGRGDAYYKSSFEPRPSELLIRPDFDPLAEVLALAKPSGINVHAWINVNLVSSAANLPDSRQHLVYRHPEWLMVPRELASEMRKTDAKSPEYVGRLARWTRAHLDEVEGLYTSPMHSDAAAHVASIAAEIVTNYDVDGVHLDYARFPNEQFDYSPAALQQFKLSLRGQLSDAERQRLDAQELVDPFAYTNFFPRRWQAFRQSRMTGLVMRIRTAVKAVNPHVLVSAAVAPDAQAAAELKLQDWRTWLEQSVVDVLCPMAYTPDPELFQRQVAAALELAGGRPVWAGVAAYRLSPTATLQHIEIARRQKVAGVILFSYDALVSPPNSVNSLAALARAAFADGSRE
jgi:uncharacterized lipoprotein YddW (UPF0748 family)